MKIAVQCASLRPHERSEIAAPRAAISRSPAQARPDGIVAAALQTERTVTRQCRDVLDALRADLRRGDAVAAGGLDEDAILARVAERIAQDGRPASMRVVNATGTVLHTNLGRALLPQPAIDAVCRVAAEAVKREVPSRARGAVADARRRSKSSSPGSPAPKPPRSSTTTRPPCWWR